MKKHIQKHKNKIALVVIVAVIIVVIAYVKLGGEKNMEDEQQTAPVQQQQQAAPQETPVEEPATPVGAQPLYPDLCYAQGGKPVAESKGCAAGEKNIGDVPGFKTPYICCAK